MSFNVYREIKKTSTEFESSSEVGSTEEDGGNIIVSAEYDKRADS